ncbi:Fc.00g018180.m01.CDS01 [Cosmosporella sp. VM-42]
MPLRQPCAPQYAARFKRYEAFDAQFDQDALAEARSWYQTFDSSQLPKGNTTYARSSGPGGQHVNKTETKAITAYPVRDLLSILPRSLHSWIRGSKYYTSNSDSLTFQAQTSRSRDANAEDNRRKLVEEVTRIYEAATPAETSEEKKKKHVEMLVIPLIMYFFGVLALKRVLRGKKFNENRMKQKKFISTKKQARRGPSD